MDHLRRTVEELRASDGCRVPLLIGGDGDRMLRPAAEHADIVAFAGARPAPASTVGRLEPATARDLDERVARTPGRRRPEPTRALALPTVLVGTPDEVTGRVRGLRERYGIS